MFRMNVSKRYSNIRKRADVDTPYKIEFDIVYAGRPRIDEIITRPADKDGIPFVMKGEIPVKIDITKASSYKEYVMDYPIERVKAVITRLEGYAPAEEESWRSYWDIDDPIQVDDFIEGLFTDPKYMAIEVSFGGDGWGHKIFDGTLNNIEFYNGAHEDGITGMDIKILDSDAIKEIEYCCSGQTYGEEHESSKRASIGRVNSRRNILSRRFARRRTFRRA